MLRLILTTYFYTLLGTFTTTVLLIMAGFGWGSLPHKYLKAVLYFQSLFEKVTFLKLSYFIVFKKKYKIASFFYFLKGF